MMMRVFQRSILMRTCAAFVTSTVRNPSAVHNNPLMAGSVITTTRLLATNFQPAAPPGTRGTPVFSDVDFNVVSEHATKRNQDPHAVFVVTGASRGIGLQFVKTLATKTQASGNENSNIMSTKKCNSLIYRHLLNRERL